MKNVAIAATIMILLTVSCQKTSTSTNSGTQYKSGAMILDDIHGDASRRGFDFSAGVSTNDSIQDMGIEPWWNSGQPAPAIMHYQWGDSTKKLIDLGNIDLQNAASVNISGITPDTATQSDMWTVDKPLVNHSYYITTQEGQDAFFMIDSIKIETDTANTLYSASIYFTYIIK